jgi:uric acid-xanthine permease
MYANGFCKTGPDGTRLPCPDAYGALIGTAAVCSLLEIALSFVPPKVLQKIFPPIGRNSLNGPFWATAELTISKVTGPTVMLIGVSLIQVGFEGWAGGSGPCLARPDTGFFKLCPDVAAPHALPWGAAQYIGRHCGTIWKFSPC